MILLKIVTTLSMYYDLKIGLMCEKNARLILNFEDTFHSLKFGFLSKLK